MTTAYIQTPEQFEQGNGYQIREELLRKAVSTCKAFATDILILLNGHTIKEWPKKDHSILYVYFRDYGISWSLDKDECDWQYCVKGVLIKAGPHVSLHFEA